MSHLASALRQIAKKSSHPNVLIHKMQLARANQKYIVRGELGAGEDGAIVLAGPGPSPSEEGEAEGEKREGGSEKEKGVQEEGGKVEEGGVESSKEGRGGTE